MRLDNTFIRNIYATDILETFLISAISSILFIRFFLAVTGYPQLGGGSIHIAHLTWGGLFLLISIIFLVSFLGNRILRISAIIGGIGFGTFIDELGKFITSDNNYFFQPTIAIIYILFLLLFFSFRYLHKNETLSSKEYLMNALQLFEEAVLKDMDKKEKRQLLTYLNAVSPNDPVFIRLKSLAEDIQVIEDSPPNKLDKYLNTIVIFGNKIINNLSFRRIVLGLFIFQTALIFITILLIVFVHLEDIPRLFKPNPPQYTIMAYGELISLLVSLILILIGSSVLRFSKLKGFIMIRRSVLVSILVTQFFVFYREQFNALYGLTLSIVALLVVNSELSRLKSNKFSPST